MITNERQYRITSAELSRLKAALREFNMKEATARTGSAILAKAERDAIESQVEDLVEQLAEYDALKSGAVETLKARNLDQLPTLLIKARIAGRLSQKQLAARLGLQEQQIQRYEAEDYASASLRRLIEVAKALGLEIREIAGLHAPPSVRSVGEEKPSIDWNCFPTREMYRRNWFSDFFDGSLDEANENAEKLVKEFICGVMPNPAPALLRSHVRAGSTMNPYALLAWQCRILRIASKNRPQTAFRKSKAGIEWLHGLTRCSQHADGPIRGREYLRDAGIDLVVEPHLEHTYLDGAALARRGSPIIGLTLRYDRLDNFWFTLIHEVIHVTRHLGKEDIEDFFDDLDAAADDVEREADRLAGDVLVPDSTWETALARYLQTPETIHEFADGLRISPAIIAGRIRREANNYMILTDLIGQGEVRKLFPEVNFGQ
jgi:HTH-type transcriptional regulator/antitoxin HigA